MIQEAIVIDNGSEKCRMGFAGEDGPRADFPSVVGRDLFKSSMIGVHYKQSYFGDEAISKITHLNLTSPFEKGIINNWNDMTSLWEHGFNCELRKQASKYSCLMTQPFQTPRAQRQKITQIMFEHFEVPRFYLEKAPKLAMYASGYASGLIVDCGHTFTQVCPFIQGHYIPYAVQINQFGGSDLNQYLIKLLKQVSLKLNSQETFKLKKIKENHCYVSMNYQAQLQKPTQCLYELPDGKKITLADQRFRCPQILFDPLIIGKKFPSLHQAIVNSIKNCDKQIHKSLCSNIFFCGGSALFPGFSERLTKQLSTLMPEKITLKKVMQKNLENANWIGGSIQASLCSFEPLYITKKQYDESGSKIINKKCNA